jgi:beta-lactamase regulating signal transducer with metallopeptidase domain
VSEGFLLESLLAVSAQVTVLFLAAAWFERRTDVRDRDRLWRVAHALALLAILQSLLLPHLRWTSLSRWISVDSLGSWQQTWSALARPVVWLVLAGIAVRVASVVLASFQSRRSLLHSAELPEMTQALRAEFPHGVFARRQGVVRLANGRVGSHCWHWQRPVIVLSRRALELSQDCQRMILRHEHAHLDAGHPLHLFVERCVGALLWFHPLVWWSSRRAELAREMHCDAPLNAADAATYLSALLALAQSEGDRTSSAPAALAFARDRSLLQERLAAFSQPAIRSRFARFAVPVLVATTILLGLFAWPPVNPLASARSTWSPWPAWTASALQSVGVTARDYETDAHRLRRHH